MRVAFWGLVAASFWFGDLLGDLGNGVLVLALVAIAGAHILGRGSRQSTTTAEERIESYDRLGNKLFLPALIIPFTAFVGTLLFNYTPLKGSGLIDSKAVTLVLLGVGIIISLAVCYAWLRPPVMAPVEVQVGEQYEKLWESLRGAGYVRVRVDGETFELDKTPTIDRRRKHDVVVVVD